MAESRVGPLVYLSVDLDKMTLKATTSRRLATPFIIITSEEKAHDFHILYINVTGNSRRSSLSSLFSSQPAGYRPLSHYLTAHPSILGYSTGPLRLEINPPVADTLFHLHSRLRTSNPAPEAVGPWVSGKEAFSINCCSRWFARNGYLAIRRKLQKGSADYSYMPVCIPPSAATEEYHIVFRLIPSEDSLEGVVENDTRQ